MRKVDLLNSIEARIPFRAAQRLLRACGFPKGQTWPSIREKLSTSSKKLDFHALNDLYLQTLVASEKSVAAFEVGSAIRDVVLKKLNKMEPDIGDAFVRKYPYILDQKTMAKTLQAGTVFAGKETLSFGLAVIFSTVRISEHREKLAPTKMPASLAKQFTEFYGVRRSYHQSYDAVIVPSSGDYIWLAADFPLNANDEYAEFAHISVRNAFNKLLGSTPLDKARNLFPLIGKLYADPSEGTVLGLSHLVSTSSVKREKMRNGNCLRKELFHKAGADAVKGQLAAFAVGVAWDSPDGEASPELHIEGESKDAQKVLPIVDRAVIRKCSTPEEMNFVLDKIVKHLP